MTLRDLSQKLRLSTHTGRAQLGDSLIHERTFRRWLAGNSNPLRSAALLLRVVTNLTPATERPMVHAVVDGEELVLLRRADLDALVAAPAPLVPAVTRTAARRHRADPAQPLGAAAVLAAFQAAHTSQARPIAAEPEPEIF